MSTHALPAGTVNFPVNMPVPLRQAAGRYAFNKARSLGAWVRGLIAREVVGFTPTLQREADEILNLDREARQIFGRIAADGVIDAEERKEFAAFLDREEAADMRLHGTTRMEVVA